MRIQRAAFFMAIRPTLFGNRITRSQLQGLEAILDHWEAGHWMRDRRFLAYMLATAYHETGRTMQPVRETFALSDEQAVSRLQMAFDAGKLPSVKEPYWQKDENGHCWFGRGLVQLTHKANYQTMSDVLKIDLVAHPEKAMDLDVAVKVMFHGMIHGTFTGKKLADYFHDTTADWVNARRIINGLDRARDVATYGQAFHAAMCRAV